jgi:hypothetical protein
MRRADAALLGPIHDTTRDLTRDHSDCKGHLHPTASALVIAS